MGRVKKLKEQGRSGCTLTSNEGEKIVCAPDKRSIDGVRAQGKQSSGQAVACAGRRAEQLGGKILEFTWGGDGCGRAGEN